MMPETCQRDISDIFINYLILQQMMVIYVKQYDKTTTYWSNLSKKNAPSVPE